MEVVLFDRRISACVFAIVVGAVAAAPAITDGSPDFSGVLSGDYSHLNGGGSSANLWGASGSGEFGFGSFAGQIDAGYHNIDFDHSSGSVGDFNVDGSLFWNGTAGRVGAVVGYNSLSGGGSHGHLTNYGGFGEWYAGSVITVGVKAGGFSGSSSEKGDYASAAATFYALPDIGLTAGYDYDHVNHYASLNTWSVNGEWLVSEHMPISVYGGYANSKVSSGGPTIGTWSIGLRLYTDPIGPAPLVARQREGAETWGTSMGASNLLAAF